MSTARLLYLVRHLPVEGAFFRAALAEEEEPEAPRKKRRATLEETLKFFGVGASGEVGRGN